MQLLRTCVPRVDVCKISEVQKLTLIEGNRNCSHAILEDVCAESLRDLQSRLVVIAVSSLAMCCVISHLTSMFFQILHVIALKMFIICNLKLS